MSGIIENMTEKKAPTETAIDILAGDVETQGFDESATKRLLRKLDWHIIPFMSLIYLCVSFKSPTPAVESHSHISNQFMFPRPHEHRQRPP
jgi:hypothetical protein